MKWTKLKIATAFIALLVLTNLLTLILLLNRISASHPGHSKPVGDFKIAVERIDNTEATPEFKFANIPSPAKTSAATSAVFSLASGAKDDNGARVQKLQDGLLPTGPNAPDEYFFFSDGSYGGRILVDLNSAIDIQQVNTYSWHTDDRSPQLYNLYAHDDMPDGSGLEPVGNKNPATLGWKLLANVDTRPKSGEPGGQYGVSISSPNGLIGHYRYLLFECKRTEEKDRWGNTFYSRIDVIAK